MLNTGKQSEQQTTAGVLGAMTTAMPTAIYGSLAQGCHDTWGQAIVNYPAAVTCGASFGVGNAMAATLLCCHKWGPNAAGGNLQWSASA
jgi:hypothetical protein